MADDKKKKTSLTNQVNDALKRSNSDSSSESELTVIQLKKKYKQEHENPKRGERRKVFANKENENPTRADEKPSQFSIKKPPSSLTYKSQKQVSFSKPSTLPKHNNQKPEKREKASSSSSVKSQRLPDKENLCSSSNQKSQNKESSTNHCQKNKETIRLPSPKRDNPISNEEVVSEDEEYSIGDPQEDELYGEHFENDMVNIGRNVFCRKKVLDMALCTSHFATHISRKLLEGVFTWSTLLKSTLTGKAPRAQGKERQMEPVQPLNIRARIAIIEFSMENAKERNFKEQTVETVEKAMTQRIGEIKRLHKRGLLHMY